MRTAGDLIRKAPLARLRRVDPLLIAVTAPAGYGKRTLVRQFLADAPLAVVCDCAPGFDELRMARALVPELALELDDGSRTTAERVEHALESWHVSPRAAVFENADALIGNDAALAALARFLKARSPSTRLVLVSRTPLPVTLTRFAAPHEICSLRARDLAFSEDELASLLAETNDAALTAAGIEATQGWPIAALLLKRLAAEGRHADLLADPVGVLADELREYLADEIFSALDPDVARGIAVCVALPDASERDIRLAFPDTPAFDHLVAYAGHSPFVARAASDTFTVHPIIARHVRERLPERGAVMRRELARASDAAGAFVRAAELYLECGEMHEAARALAQGDMLALRTIPHDYLRVLSRLGRTTVQRYPRLWGVSVLVRLSCGHAHMLLDEAELVWRTLPADVPIVDRYYVFAMRVSAMLAAGRTGEALAAVDAFEAELHAQREPPQLLRERLTAQRGAVRARAGMIDAAERDLHVALAHVDGQVIPASGLYLALGADVARARGERALERQFLERAIEFAQASQLQNLLAAALAEGVAGAWLAGEDAHVRTLAEGLDAIVVTAGIDGLRYFTASANGRADEPAGTDLPRFVLFGTLMRLEQEGDDERRRAMARSAVALARRIETPLLLVLAYVAHGLCDDEQRDDALAAAAETARGCDSSALAAAIAELRDGRAHAGMLSSFIAAVERRRVRRTPPIALEVLREQVAVEGNAVRVSGREFELLVAIAARREGTTRARLCSLLWPDVDEGDARNALSVQLHRLRSHLGRAGAIERDGDVYRLPRDAHVDLWDIERASQRARVRLELSEVERARLHEVLSMAVAGAAPASEAWEWFAPYRRALDDAKNRIFVRLANDALAAARVEEALEYVNAALALDPCDESACEIGLRALLKRGDRGEALRLYRRYRDALQRELGVEPSLGLARLVRA